MEGLGQEFNIWQSATQTPGVKKSNTVKNAHPHDSKWPHPLISMRTACSIPVLQCVVGIADARTRMMSIASHVS